MSQTDYQLEALDEVLLREVEPLAAANHAETGSLADVSLAIDRELYLGLQASGSLRVYTARKAGALIGYTSLIVRRHPHHGGLLAAQDTLFVHRDWRHGPLGMRLIRFADARLAVEGVVAVYRQSTARRDISPLLTRMGYYESERTYMRRLG